MRGQIGDNLTINSQTSSSSTPVRIMRGDVDEPLSLDDDAPPAEPKQTRKRPKHREEDYEEERGYWAKLSPAAKWGIIIGGVLVGLCLVIVIIVASSSGTSRRGQDATSTSERGGTEAQARELLKAGLDSWTFRDDLIKFKEKHPELGDFFEIDWAAREKVNLHSEDMISLLFSRPRARQGRN